MPIDPQDVIRIHPDKQVVTCTAGLSIAEAAGLMASQRIGSLVVVDERQHPIGIVTDADFSRKVVAQGIPATDPVSRIMSSPVHTVQAGSTVAEFILAMMRWQIRHLVMTEDGSPHSPLTGIVSERDLLLIQGRSPVGMVRRMQKTSSVAALAEIRRQAGKLVQDYLRQELPIPFVAHVITEINDTLIQRVVELGLRQLEAEGLPQPGLRFAWLSLGSEGRGEQLLRTDQDNALVYEDPPAGDADAASAYFLKLAKVINTHLETCGFEKCPAGIMGSTPAWNQPLSGWKQHFADWIHVPEPSALLHTSIFFDFRCTYGESLLADSLSASILEEIRKARRFMHFLAQNAVDSPPPQGFLKNLVLSRAEGRGGKFDLKLRAMMPLTDAARVLSLHHGLMGVTNTFQRFERIAGLESAHDALFKEAAIAYESYMRHRALSGFAHGDSGRYIDPRALSKLQRRTLKYSFSTIKAVQQVLKSRFDLNLY